jgi:signal transduction histidine kinase
LGGSGFFVQNASRQLRTLITIALAHAELLPQPGADRAAAGDAEIVIDELARLRRLADQLLLLATAERSDSLRLAPARLQPMLEDALRRWEPVPRRWLAGRHDDATVLADPGQLVLALDSLMENAVGFTGDGDQIELSAHRHQREVAIIVADSGAGTLRTRSHQCSGGSPGPARSGMTGATSASACRSCTQWPRHMETGWSPLPGAHWAARR